MRLRVRCDNGHEMLADRDDRLTGVALRAICPRCGVSVPIPCAEPATGGAGTTVDDAATAAHVPDGAGLSTVHDPRTAAYSPGDGVTQPHTPTSNDVRQRFPSVPGYEVLSELGRGGMGVVYKARDGKLGRLVALKMIRAGEGAGDEERRRFHDEARAVARLRHPNIVQVYEVGEWRPEGGGPPMPYFALEFVEGGSLDRRLARQPQPPADAARLLATLARAIDHAHRAGVVHRDLKPANVLLDCRFTPSPLPLPPGAEQGPSDSIVNRQSTIVNPKITDFGLAKRLDAGAGYTQAGQILGTPTYMAPEQAAGEVDRVGPPADLYSLGAILYEMLTGRPPFREANVWDTLDRVRHHDPVPPRQLQPTVPRDLETICLKCLQKEPRKRYDSAAALADDLDRFLDGRPIHARPISPAERLARWARRRPAVASLLVVLLASLAVGFTLVARAWGAAERESDRLRQESEATGRQTEQARQARETATKAQQAAIEQERHSREARDRAALAVYTARVRQAGQEWAAGLTAAAADSLQACPEELRGWEWHYLHGQLNADYRTFPGRQCAAWSADGKRLAVAGKDGSARLYDAADNSEVRSFSVPGAIVHPVALHPGGTMLAAGDTKGTVTVWEIATGRKLYEVSGSPGGVSDVAFSGDGKHAAACTAGGLVLLWQAEGGEVLLRHQGTALPIGGVAFVPPRDKEPPLLAASGPSNSVLLWELPGLKPLDPLKVRSTATRLAATPDGRHLAVAGFGGVTLFDLSTRRVARNYSSHRTWIAALAISPDGRRLAAGGQDGVLKVWDTLTGQTQRFLRGHRRPLSHLAFHPNRPSLVSIGWEEPARVWNLEEPTEARTLRGPAAAQMPGVALRPDGREVAACANDGSVWLWDPATARVIRSWNAHAFWALSVAYSPDGKTLATAGQETADGKGEVKLWDVESGALLRRLELPDRDARGMTFSPDGSLLAASCQTRAVVWELATGREIFSKENTGTPVALSPDGRTLATLSLQVHPQLQVHLVGVVKLWDLRTGENLATLPALRESLGVVAFDPKGRWLVGAGGQWFERSEFYIWDLKTQEIVRTLAGHQRRVTDLAVSPDSERIFTASMDGTVRVWEARTGQELLTLTGHHRAVMSLSLGPGGHVLASSSADGTVKLWNARPR